MESTGVNKGSCSGKAAEPTLTSDSAKLAIVLTDVDQVSDPNPLTSESVEAAEVAADLAGVALSSVKLL